jgi:predicted esterase
MTRGFLAIFFLVPLIAFAQTRLDETIPFMADPAKGYSIFLPSSYDEAVSNPVFLALHPLNTRRWNAISWTDTLSAFAESNGLVLIAPDGGADGRIDDPIDTAFTTFLLDSMFRRYNLDEDKLYAIGFSWGGRTTYTYGLSNVDRFSGFVPIGAAINGLNEIGGLVDRSRDKPFFVIHGSNDATNTRYFPAVTALEDNGACLMDTLMPGIGHTIDFPGRNALLSAAYTWLKEQNCGLTSAREEEKEGFPNVPSLLSLTQIDIIKEAQPDLILDVMGRRTTLDRMQTGLFILVKRKDGRALSKKIVITH